MSAPIRGFLFDLDGVLVTGGQALPGAIATLQRLCDTGVPFLILTNMTLWPRSAVFDRFRQHGLDLPLDCMLTPPVAAARWLQQQHAGPVAAFVAAPTRPELAGLHLLPDDAEQGADYVVIGDMGDGWDARQLNRALRLLLGGGRLVSLGLGRYWRAPDGLRLDCGAFTSALSFASGQSPVVIGKPSPDYFQAALASLGRPPEAVAMIGDDILNDVGAAQALGMRAALVQTGKFQPSDLQQSVQADWVLPGVGGVLDLLQG